MSDLLPVCAGPCGCAEIKTQQTGVRSLGLSE